MKCPRTAQSGLKWVPPKGGHVRDANARPGGKGLGFKNHEAPIISWAGLADRCSSHGEDLVLIGATGPVARVGRLLSRSRAPAPTNTDHPADAF